MPPEGEEAPKPAEIDVLKAWIAAGAKGPTGAGPDPTMLVTPQVKLLAPPKLAIHAVALSPAGRRAGDRPARRSRAASRSPIRNRLHKLAGIRGSVNGVAFSRDGQFVVAAAGEPGLFGEARLYRTERRLAGHGVPRPQGQPLLRRAQPRRFAARHRRLRQRDQALERRRRQGSPHARRSQRRGVRAGLPAGRQGAGQRQRRPHGQAVERRHRRAARHAQGIARRSCTRWPSAPTASRLAAAGVDNRIRVWQITPEAKEGTNPLLVSKFAHESPVLRLVWSADGKTLASSGEDRLVKLWNAETMTIRQTLPRQSDWASGLAISSDGDTLAIGRVDGSAGHRIRWALPTAGANNRSFRWPKCRPKSITARSRRLNSCRRSPKSSRTTSRLRRRRLPAPGIATGSMCAGDRNAAARDDATSSASTPRPATSGSSKRRPPEPARRSIRRSKCSTRPASRCRGCSCGRSATASSSSAA